jgi:hypothetical protein
MLVSLQHFKCVGRGIGCGVIQTEWKESDHCKHMRGTKMVPTKGQIA